MAIQFSGVVHAYTFFLEQGISTASSLTETENLLLHSSMVVHQGTLLIHHFVGIYSLRP